MNQALCDVAAAFYEEAPTGQYDDEAAHALRNHCRLLAALELVRPFIAAWPQCREKELLVVDAVIKEAKGT